MTEQITSTEGRTKEQRAADPWGFWRAALAIAQGKEGVEPPVVGEIPEVGYYRTRNRAGNNYIPVAYWLDSVGSLVCKVGDKMVDTDTAMRGWPWAQNQPITYEAYQKAMAGEPWPDVDQNALELSNNPPDDENLESMQEAIDKLAVEGEKLIQKGGATTQAEADMATQIANAFGGFETKADAARVKHKAPHLQKSRDVDDAWRPLITKAERFKKEIKAKVITPFLQALARKKAEAEEAERKRLAAAAASGQPAAPAPAPAPKIETKAGGGVTRSVGLRTVKKAVIEDRAKVLKHFKDTEEMTEFLQELCDKAAKAGIAIKGMKIVEDTVAA